MSREQMKIQSENNVREGFRNSASNVAKVHKKYWPMLGHLIREKKRKRTNSNMSESSYGSNSGSSNNNTPGKHTIKSRAQSFNESAASVLKGIENAGATGSG